MNEIESRREPKVAGYLHEATREFLLAVIILTVLAPLFHSIVAGYAKGLIRQAENPSFQDSVRKLKISRSDPDDIKPLLSDDHR